LPDKFIYNRAEYLVETQDVIEKLGRLRE